MMSNAQTNFAAAFIGGEAPSKDRCYALASGVDCIVAADSGLIACEIAGLTPDFIVGDMDSLEQKGEAWRLDKYPQEKISRCSHDKDQTDTEIALDLLHKRGHKHIRIIGGGGGRFDHLFAIREIFERENPPQSWHIPSEDIYCIEKSIEMPSAPAATVSLLPLGNGPWDIHSEGLRWQTKGVGWKRGFVAISNEATADLFSLRIFAGRFMLILPAEH